MDIKEVLHNRAIKDRIADIDGKKYPYYFMEYNYREKFFAQYYIIDFVNCEEYSEFEGLWNSIEEFEKFERLFLEDAFYNSRGDTRFNLYFVLIVNPTSHLLSNSSIRRDFKYARKVILMEDQLEEFFIKTFPLRRKNEIGYSPEKRGNREIIDGLHKLIKDALSISQQEIYTRWWCAKSNRKNIRFDEKTYEIMALCNRANRLIGETDKKEPLGKTQLSASNYIIQKIEEIKINKYRCYNKQCLIPFGKVNLLFGENGVGKTTLLEAIEFGITGVNRKNGNEELKSAEIEVKCLNDRNNTITFNSTNNYEALAELWYGIKAEGKEAFNQMFNQYNYFDTGFASAFAIEGQKKENLLQLQKFLGIEKIEELEYILNILYKELILFSKENAAKLEKANKNKKVFRKPEYIFIEKKMMNSQNAVKKCENGINELRDEIEIISLTEILNSHIKKIESIFKLLSASNEYSQLKVVDSEIVAIRSENNAYVSMAMMSTGQKVCLALAFMFALFLSNEKAPNVILLDEPAANLDDLHMLNLLDVLRRLALSDTQIFFTTADPSVAQLFRRKFSFLENEFRYFRINESEQDFKVQCEIYSPYNEEALRIEKII